MVCKVYLKDCQKKKTKQWSFLSWSKIWSLSGVPRRSSRPWANPWRCSVPWRAGAARKRTPLTCCGWETASPFSTRTPTSSRSTPAATAGQSSARSGRQLLSLLVTCRHDKSSFVVRQPHLAQKCQSCLCGDCVYYLFPHFIRSPHLTSTAAGLRYISMLTFCHRGALWN